MKSFKKVKIRFCSQKSKRRCNNLQWKISKIWDNEINGIELECLINDYEAFIDESVVTVSGCKEIK